MSDEPEELSESVELLKKIVELDPKGEHRPQQEVAVDEIEQALTDGHHLLLESGTGTGKALDVDTPIITMGGWKTMGTLEEGDIIFDEKGQPTKITHVHEPFISEETYELLFSDGTFIVADAEHLWATSTRSLRKQDISTQNKKTIISHKDILGFANELNKSGTKLASTISIVGLERYGFSRFLLKEAASSLAPVGTTDFKNPVYDTIKLLERTYVCSLNNLKFGNKNKITTKVVTSREIASTLMYSDTHKNHAIPVVEAPLQFKEKTLIVPPYTFGAWLGDGSANSAQITSYESEILELIKADGIFIQSRTDIHEFGLSVNITPANNRWHDSITKRLQSLSVIKNKHIPSIYLESSIEQRYDLLSGLLDTDGYIDKNGIYEICLTKKELIYDVRTLVESLGYKASLREGIASYNGKVTGPKWTVSFVAQENLFKLTRKREMFLERKAKNFSPLRNNLRYIVSANRVSSRLVRCISVDSRSHLFLAGKNLIPTHNTLSYLIPLIVTGKRAVVSTATKQLSEQITKEDIPLLQKTVSQIDPTKSFSSALLKGRENYFCYKKSDEAKKLDDDANTLFGTVEVKLPSSAKAKVMMKQIGNLTNWADKTKTGDRSEAPAVDDDVWRQYSSTSTECPGKQTCPFGDICFAEKAREKAKAADVVVTNHAVVAHDLISESVLLGDRKAFVFDELHELDNYLSSAWGTRLSAKIVKDAHKTFKQYMELGEKEIEDVERIGKRFDKALEALPEGLIEGMSHELSGQLVTLNAAVVRISTNCHKKMNDANVSEPIKNVVSVIKKKADEIVEATQLLMDDSIQTVRWVSIFEETPSLYAAPLRVGPALQNALREREAIMIGTSATITVGGTFDIPVHNLALDNTEKYKAISLGTPFDYEKQAMMFIPSELDFPAPTGADRKEHTEAVKRISKELVEAMGGRALILSTTTFGARSIADSLRKALPKMNILAQGDAPNAQLIEEFKADEKSVLVATMGMWHGVNAPGKTASLIIIDKIPFKPMDDPLSVARQRYADDSGRNGFMDVYVAEANVMLAQGVGRLIRSKTDKGVVVILDTRLMTKAYGKSMLKSFPPMKIFNKKGVILGALKRLAETYDKDAS